MTWEGQFLSHFLKTPFEDPNGNMVEFCLTTGSFTEADRARALAALDERTMNPSPPPASMRQWLARDRVQAETRSA